MSRIKFGHYSDGRKLLFVGIPDRFHLYEGLTALLDALRAVNESFELTVVDHGKLRAEYSAQQVHQGLPRKPISSAESTTRPSLIHALTQTSICCFHTSRVNKADSPLRLPNHGQRSCSHPHQMNRAPSVETAIHGAGLLPAGDASRPAETEIIA
jgi:hypothetical protein